MDVVLVGSSAEHVAHSLQDGILRSVIWLVLAWNLQDSGHGLSVGVDQVTNEVSNTLIYEDNGDIRSSGKILESSFDIGSTCFFVLL